MRFSILVAILAAVACGCTSHDHPKEIAFTPAPVVAPTPCAFLAQMYPVSQSSFAAHKVTMVERKVIDHWAATVPATKQKYVRWMRFEDGVIVFVANPDYMDKPKEGSPPTQYYPNPKDGTLVPMLRDGYHPWMALNTNMIVDPVSCEVHAYPTAMITDTITV